MNKDKKIEIWKALKVEIESKSFNQLQISLSLEGSKILELKNNILILGVETKINEVILNKIHYQEILKVILEKIGSDVKLKIIYFGDYSQLETTKELENFVVPISDTLNPKYTFNNFIVSNKNKMIYTACLAVSISENSDWNPLFIYGKSGLGKTHLLHAIGNSRKHNFPNHSIKYIEAKDFGKIVMDAMDAKNINSEIDKINKEFFGYDILLVDDIQFIKTRKKTKEVFFNIFNYFMKEGKNIVFTSDLPPKDLGDFEERFTTRFISGLIVNVSPPDYKTTTEILKLKIENSNEFSLEDFDDEAINWIALNFSDNVRFLEGALNRLMLYFITNSSDINNEQNIITLQFVKEIFKDIKTNKTGLTQDKIINYISKRYSIPNKELISKSRKRDILEARNIAIYLIRNLIDIPLVEIGKKFERDHSTILNSLKKIKIAMETNKELNFLLKDMQNELTNH